MRSTPWPSWLLGSNCDRPFLHRVSRFAICRVGGPLVFLAFTLVWTITSSALRAPPLMLLGKYAAKPSIPYLSSLAMLGYGIAGALGPYLAITLRDVDPRCLSHCRASHWC